MKNILLLLSALIVAPVWAGSSSHAPMHTATAAQGGVEIEIEGPAKDVSALVADLEKETVYKEAGCSSTPAKKPGGEVKIKCAKADSALMTLLSKNAPTKVQWSISSSGDTVAACPPGCALINCPPPGGPVRCCNTTTFQPC